MTGRRFPEPDDPLAQSFADNIVRGSGLVFNCRVCGIDLKWTDQELLDRFILSIDLPMSVLRTRTKCPTCKGPLHIYQYNAGTTVKWRAVGLLADTQRIMADRYAELREWAAGAIGKAETAVSYAAAKRRV